MMRKVFLDNLPKKELELIGKNRLVTVFLLFMMK